MNLVNKLSLLFLLSMFFINCYSQESLIRDIDSNLLTKYISLALQNYPRKLAFDERAKRAKSTLNAAKLSWFDPFFAGFYYRPENGGIGVSGGGASGSSTQLFTNNGFQFGINVSLGNLLSKPALVKGAKTEYNAAKAESAEYDVTLVAEVKTRYYDYLLAKKQLELRNLSAQNLKVLLNDAKGKYERGEITLDTYTTSQNAATESEAALLSAEDNYLKAKTALEVMIGMQLENVK